MDEWTKLKKIVVEWIQSHDVPSMDENLATWLDPTNSIVRNYKVILLNKTSGKISRCVLNIKLFILISFVL